MITKKYIVSFLLTSMVFILFNATVYAVDGQQSNAGGVNTESVVDYEYIRELEAEADKFFYTGINTEDQKLREAYLSKALAKYMLLLKFQPDNAIFCTQIAVIHDICNHIPQAKEYFFRAINLENLNPFANFYFAEYYFINKDYNNALKHYLIAYNNGYKDYYQVNLKIAKIYERLGDIEKAKIYYTNTKNLNPSLEGLESKIQSLDNVYYSKEDYRPRTIRE